MPESDRLRRFEPNTIYGLCDRALLSQFGLSLDDYVRRCRCHGVGLIQYRDKNMDEDAVAQQLKELRRIWDGILIVNDRWKLAPLCDGVHLGQEDLFAVHPDPAVAVAMLRERMPKTGLLGLSTHNAAEIEAANRLPIDYIGLGAYRATGTKEGARVLGPALDALAADSLHPVAAIGGIGFDDFFEHAAFRVMGRALMERSC